jgi:hypothetical protein
MDVKELRAFAKTHKFVAFMTGVGFLVIAIVIFEAGVFVGFHKAAFAYGWEQNYGRNFGDPRGALGFPDRALPIGHGADGRVISVSKGSFVVVGGDEAEKTIRVSSSTIIRAASGATTSAALANGSYVVVIGEPDASGTVSAQLVRILPPPMDDEDAEPAP